jgi:hypothetical protein
MPSDDYLLSILATFKDSASPELKKLGQSITGVEKATDAAKPKAKSFGSSITALSGQFLVATQAAGQVVAAVKQMYEFAKVGAVVQQTEDSFDGLIDKLGVTPDLLDDLREASDGTISDMRLMSATTTLLAGAQGELASALADATPELLEIAKAANKLNPSLGDTAFLYESLATGIKRASPMILDNLGLTIKIGEANEKYAASIGKTVEQLTAEEQKLALLIETRRAGNVLIEQAGGAAGSATDDFARLEAATENLSNAFKKQLTPSVANFAEALADMLTERQTLEKLLRDETQAVLETSKSYDEYVSQANEVVAAHGFIYDSTGQLTEAMKEWNLQTGEEFLISTGKAVEGAKILTEQQYDLLASLDDMGPTVRRTGDNFGYYEEELYRVVAAEKIAEDAALKLEAAQLRINDALGDLATTMSGAVGDEIDDYAKKHASLADDLRKAERSIAELRAEEGFPTEDQLGRLGDYRANALGIADDMRTLAEEHREAMNSIVFDLTMARLEADGFTEAELTLATSLAEGMGLVDERTATAMRNINSSISTFDEGGNLGQAADDILAIASGLTDIEVPTGVTAALGSGIGLVENWGVLAQEQIGTTYAETTSSVEEESDTKWTLPSRTATCFLRAWHLLSQW